MMMKSMRMLSETPMEVKRKIDACFIDWKKAFDRVSWMKLMMIIKITGIDWRHRRVTKELY